MEIAASGYTIDLTMTQEIENRIRKAQGLALKLDTVGVEASGLDKVREMVVEDTITSVLSELLESLKNGESLTEAIETIQSNF